MKKIVLTGPESSGKTTLAVQLAAHFQTVWVPEFARTYLEKLGRAYEKADLLEIAKGQITLEDEFSKKAGHLIIIDTSLEVIKIWSEVRFGECDPWILEQLCLRQPDLYLLCQPNLPWTFDPLRENPHDRDALYQIYRQELTALGIDFIEIKGIGEIRFLQASAAINAILKT